MEVDNVIGYDQFIAVPRRYVLEYAVRELVDYSIYEPNLL